MARVLIIVGSMRTDSFNRQMAKAIEGIIRERVEVAYLNYSDIPFMNQDIEYPAPEAIARVRAEVTAADGIWICTPEYNSNIPGVLKNLLDWLSRPLSPGDFAGPTAAAGKIVTISGAAGRSGASGVRASLAKLLEMMRMNLVGGEGTGISLSGEAFMTGKYTFTEENITQLKKQADVLLETMGV